MRIRTDPVLFRNRSRVVLFLALGALGLLHFRLVQLQIIEGEKWARLAENNRLRRIPVPAPRGRIFDRQGVVMADNAPIWKLLVFPDEADDLDRTVAFLVDQGIVEGGDLQRKFAARRIRTMAPLVAAEDISWEHLARVRTHQSDFPELSIVSGFRRSYPWSGRMAHAIGYLRRLTPAEAEGRENFQPDQMIGATGIEALGEDLLQGRYGERRVVVSAVGRQLGMVDDREPVPGHDLVVTIDTQIQQAAVEALGDNAGAVVVLDVHTGAVRALYSSPSFDPNVFSAPLSPEQWSKISNDPQHPLQNRCFQGTYPPASTIKPFLALAGLQEGLIDPQWSVYCRGSITLYGHTFRCWRRGGHGAVNLKRGLEVSCDVYFYLLGQKLGIERMASWLERFGWGGSTGLGPTQEAAGLIGTPEWSRRVRGTPWYAGESVSVSIGQGPVLVTTLQMARSFALLANGGYLVQPHLISQSSPFRPEYVPLDREALDVVVAGLERVVHGKQGTARVLGDLPVAGKTGTAQVARLPDEGSTAERPRHLQHHAWFVGWGPIEDPEFAVAVLVEHGGSGGSVAAPAAATIFRAAFRSGLKAVSDGEGG
ncbi:MAG: penicillin-binding protein 2 [Acidobacteria bacterium]|nr:penicillin-binding protein 2 [Acidobacteriota bacterium]